MPLVLGALFNPTLERLLVGCGQNLVRLLGRHGLVLVLRDNAGPQFALCQVTGNDGPDTIAIGQGPFPFVQTQLGLPLLRVLTMAGEAILRKNGPHVAIEPNAIIRREGPRQSDGKSQHSNFHTQRQKQSCAEVATKLLSQRES